MIAHAATGAPSQATFAVADVNPKDTVSCMQAIDAKGRKLLAAGSWDGSLNVYEVNEIKATNIVSHAESNIAIMRLCFNETGEIIYFATSSGEIRSLTISSKQVVPLGNHKERVVGIGYYAAQKVVVACSADGCLQIWNATSKQSKKEIKIQGKPTAMASYENSVFVATDKQKIFKVDLNKPDTQEHIDSKEKRQGLYTCLAINPQPGNIQVLAGSTYGAVEMIVGHNSKIFEAHRNGNQAFAVNAVAITQRGFGISGGTDGKLCFYVFNSVAKTNNNIDLGKDVHVTALASIADGIVAYAVGNDWSKGAMDKTQQETQIIIRKYAAKEIM